MSVPTQKSWRPAPGEKPNRKQGAFRIQGLFRSYRSRNKVKKVIRIIYVKKYDVETDRCYYENTKTGETSDVKPINLRSEDLDEPDTGTPWHCAFCENINKGLQLNCRVCKRDKESSLKRKQLEEEEKKKEIEAEKARIKEEKAKAHAEELERRKAREAIKIPFAPLGAGARATKKGAVVWWTPGSDGGKPVTKYHIVKYRLDLGEWKRKGEITMEVDEGVDCTYRYDEGLQEAREYRFTIIAENEDGRCEKESDPTNKVEPGCVLPEGWEKNKDKAGRTYYFNRTLNKTSWTIPKADKYQIAPDLRIKFPPGDIERMQVQFNQYDADGSGEIDKNELGQLLKRLGESVKPLELENLMAKIDDDGSGEISFQEFVQMMEWINDGKLSIGTKLLKNFSGFAGKLGKSMGKIFGKKKMTEEEKNKRKMGDWEQSYNKNIGKPYYFNKKTGESTWKRPHEVLYWLPEKTRKKFDEEEIRGFEEDFAAFDLDASGAIDERELMLCFKDMKIEIDGKRLRKLLASVDEDGSGELEFDEFVDMIWRIRNGKGFGLGDVFSGKARKLKKKQKKVKSATQGGDVTSAAQQRQRRKRHVFPKMADWLFDHGLTRYENTFIHAGFRQTESLYLMKEEDMDTLGMKRGHKRKLMAALKRLKHREENYVKNGVKTGAIGNGDKYKVRK